VTTREEAIAAIDEIAKCRIEPSLVVGRQLLRPVFREVYDQWVNAGRPTAPPRPRPLRLRIEPEGAAGPHWLTLLALIGWLRGVVEPGIVGGHAN